jgi:hypothetical protein
MDNNKTEFVSNVQKWVQLDAQLKIANERIKQIRDTKNTLTTQICVYMDKTKDSKQIELSDGNLKIYERKDYSPLTYSYVEESLRKIIPNEEHVNYIIKYLKDNREITTVQDIRRTVTK